MTNGWRYIHSSTVINVVKNILTSNYLKQLLWDFDSFQHSLIHSFITDSRRHRRDLVC